MRSCSARGIESLPVVLLLGAVLAACTLGLGTRALIQEQKLNERQKAIEGFNSFIERARMASAGGLGSVQHVELELTGAEIMVDANLVQLVVGEEVLRSELMPLPLVSEGGKIGEGSYAIELKRSEGYFLEIKRI